jgi:serine/threonine protein kinase
MSTLLVTTNIQGGVEGNLSLTNRQLRSQEIAGKIDSQVTEGDAHTLLTNLRDGLQNRTGRIRLIHTTDANTTMAFENFKSSFRHYRTLETKAALIAYFDKAGLDTGPLNAYLGTITTTAGKIQANSIYGILDQALKQPRNQQAPDQIVNIPQPNIIQGGAEQNVPTGGVHSQRPAVASQPPAEQNVGPNQAVVANKPSAPDIDDFNSKGSYAPGRQKLPALNQPQPPVVSNADLQAGNFAFVPPPTQFTLHEAIDNAGVDFANKTEIGKGGFGQAYQVNRGGETVVLKVPNVQNVNKFPKVTMITLNGKPRLYRSNEVTAAYLKSDKISNVCIPTDFLVHITRDGKSSYEMIRAGQDFKKWALAELQTNPRPEIRIAGSIMPQASGTVLSKQIAPNKLKPDDLQAIAKKSLETFGQFANQGFVHGDIKPENMIYDPAGKQLTFIDMGGLAKISQKSQKLEKYTQFDSSRGVTSLYSHPSTLAGKKVGHEQDFFSMGMTILLTSYITNNRDWRTLDQSIEGWKKATDPALSLRANLRERVGNPTAGSLEDMALRLIEISLEGKSPIMPARAKAILTELANHAAVGGVGLPPVDLDSLKPPRNFSSIQATVETRSRAGGEFNPEDFKYLGDFLDNQSKGEVVALKFGINVPKADEELRDHLAEHAKSELDEFANSNLLDPTINRKQRQADFEKLTASRTIRLEGDNKMEVNCSQPLDPQALSDLNARLLARNLPPLEQLNAVFLPAFLSNKFLDGLLHPGTEQSKALKSLIFDGGAKTSQTVRILEDGTIRIEASRTRRVAQLPDNSKKIINLDKSQSSLKENIILELRLQPTSANKPPAAEIVIKDVSYEVNLCK